MEAERSETASPGANLAAGGGWERREQSGEGRGQKEPRGPEEMKRGGWEGGEG